MRKSNREVFVYFLCSQVVDKQTPRNAVFAAAQSGRSVRILHQLTQPGDHPVNIYHPEARVFERAGAVCGIIRFIYILYSTMAFLQDLNLQKRH